MFFLSALFQAFELQLVSSKAEREGEEKANNNQTKKQTKAKKKQTITLIAVEITDYFWSK